MIHLVLFLYIISLCAGAAAVAVSVLLYFRYHNRVIFFYSLMLGVVTLIVAGRMTGVYAVITGAEHIRLFLLASTAFRKAGFILGLFAGPFFCHELIGTDMARTKRNIYLGIGALFSAGTIIELAINPSPAAETIRLYFGTPLLFGLYLHLMLLGALRLGKLGSRMLNNALIVFFALSIIMLPFSFFQYLTQKPFLPHYMENPLAFLGLNILGIVFAIRYFNHPPYLANDTLTEHFKARFKITQRESEIILALTNGWANAEISEKLFISPRTVESHLYNIFLKTGVKNRVQLVNLIRTNRQD